MDDQSSASYIRLVQHLIENCLLLKMSKEECMEALSKHAKITPVITSTVWKELEKENKDFFKGYWKNREMEVDTTTTTTTTTTTARDMMENMLATAAQSSTKDSQ